MAKEEKNVKDASISEIGNGKLLGVVDGVLKQIETDKSGGLLTFDKGVSEDDINVEGGVTGFNPIGEVKQGDNRAVSGEEVYNEFSKILSEANNLFDGVFETGYYTAVGNPHPSINWLRTPLVKVPDSLKGQQVTISGFGNCSSNGARVLIKNSVGDNIEIIVGQGSSNLNPVTFFIPNDADEIAFTIANDPSDGGIGSRPTNNIYVDSFMWNLGNTALPYEKPSGRLKSSMLDYDVVGEDLKNKNEIENTNEIIDSFTVSSVNLFNTKTEVIAGSFQNTGVISGTLNAIRTVIKDIPIELIGQKATVSGGGRLPTSRAIVSFFDASEVFLSNIVSTGVNPFPLTFDIPLNAVKWGFTIANDDTEGGIGTRPTDNIYTNTFQVEAGEQATTPIPLGDVYLDGDKIVYTSGNTDFNTNEIVLIKTNATTCQLLIHMGGDNDIWFKTTFFRQTNVDRFIDTWRLNEGWIVRRTGDFTFVNVKQVILTGVWENAIYTSGAGYTDALGSAHGWEQLVNTSIFLDGKNIDLSTITTGIKGSYFNVFQRSNFKTSDGLSNIGVSLKEWKIKDGIITIKNTINWLGTLNVLENSYLSMLSVMRKNGNVQITTSALSNEDMNVYDVSEFGFETPIYTNGTDPKRTNIVIWGDGFKASMNVSKRLVKKSNGDVLLFGLPNAGMYVQNTELYNKLYGRFGSDTLENGDAWEVETVYKISL